MGPPGHVFGFGTYGRVGSFFVLGTYGGWVATLENPFGTLEALETPLGPWMPWRTPWYPVRGLMWK